MRRDANGRSTRRLAVIGVPLALALVLMAVLSVGADDDARTETSGATLVQYQITLVDAGRDRWEVLMPDGFEYVGLAAGSEVTVEPEVSNRRERVVWSGAFPDALEARFWVFSKTAAVAPATLLVEGTGVEAVRVEPLTGLLVEEEAEATIEVEPAATTEVEADATAEAGAEGTPEVGAEPTIEVQAEATSDIGDEPTPGVGTVLTSEVEVQATPDGEPEPVATEEVEAGATPEADVEATAEVTDEATPEVDVEAPASVDLASVSFVKSVQPDVLEPGDWRRVTYEVVFTNSGGGTATLDFITDTLPSGFSFGGAALGSDFGQPSDDQEPDIVWEGVTVPGHDTRTLRYYAFAVNRAGDFENSVVAQAGSELIGPEKSTLYVEGGSLFLPVVIRNYPEIVGVPLPYEENFNVDPPPFWEPFTNYPGLDANRWWAEGTVYNYQWNRFVPNYKYWDLSMFNAPGTELWTDYRIEARMKDSKETNFQRGMACIWFRGSYENSGAMDGEIVGGYYLCMRPHATDAWYRDRVFLMRIRKGESRFDVVDIVDWYHYWDEDLEIGIRRKVWYDVVIEVRGNNIKAWFGRPDDWGLVEVVNWTDTNGAWESGTVGFATYITTARYDYIRVLPLD